MKEDLLQFIWQHQLFDGTELISEDGDQIQIINPGNFNHDAGPDFLNASIQIEGVTWYGNIEIHIQSGDWYKHHHNNDKRYESVILHVVYAHNKIVNHKDGSAIPVLELKNRIDGSLIENYKELLMTTHTSFACENQIHKIPAEILGQWHNKLLDNRLEKRHSMISMLLQKSKGDWDSCFYQFLSWNFGFRINNEAFIALTNATPFKLIKQHLNNIEDLESLLFGQSGLLEGNVETAYQRRLIKRYSILQVENSLTPIEGIQWKYNRMRPMNFPTLRIAQFAMLWHKHPHLLNKILSSESLEDLYKIFDIEASDFWFMHFQFNNKSTPVIKRLGKSAIDLILINCIIPFVHYYGTFHQQIHIARKSMLWFEILPSEKNKIISQFSEAGFVANNAAEGQSLLHLKKTFCDLKKCVSCNIGKYLIQNL